MSKENDLIATPQATELNIPAIDYSLIADAISYYKNRGFKSIAAPWVVSEESVTATAHPGSRLYPLHNEGFLVASGEQSFLELMRSRQLDPGRYHCITPCFRDDKQDSEHYRYFMKVELIDTCDFSRVNLASIVECCKRFFSQYLPVKIVDADNLNDPLGVANTAYDIVSEISCVELGSYGMRQAPEIGEWIYATGCAEPRLSGEILKARNVN